VPRVILFYFFGLGGPKLLQLQNIRGCFVVFFLRGQNRNFGKVRGLKLQLSQKYNVGENNEKGTTLVLHN